MTTPTNEIVADLVSKLDANLVEAFEERAAIREFDGGINRELAEALALLVTGRNLRGVSGADRQRLSNAALALGTIGGDLLASNLGAEIGITGDAARGTEAFTIGKYLTPKLFIGYGIGLARRGSVLIVRYLIRDDIEFEATNGEQSRASLNYIIEK